MKRPHGKIHEKLPNCFEAFIYKDTQVLLTSLQLCFGIQSSMLSFNVPFHLLYLGFDNLNDTRIRCMKIYAGVIKDIAFKV